MTQINTITEQPLTISLENISFRNVGGYDTPDAKTTDISGYGCPDCNEERPNNRLETQESGLFWCCCCGVTWELFDKTTEEIGNKKLACRNCFWAARDLKRHRICIKHQGDIQENDVPTVCKGFIWETANQSVINEKQTKLDKFNENYSNGIYG